MVGMSSKTLVALVMFAIVISAINTMVSLAILATKYTEMPKHRITEPTVVIYAPQIPSHDSGRVRLYVTHPMPTYNKTIIGIPDSKYK